MEREPIFPRDLEADLLNWLERREAYAIKGPRQSGKTTLLRILEDTLKKKGIETVFLSFEDPDVLEAFEANPKEYVRSFLLREGRYCFLMDKYHYVKDPGKKLKLLYDTFEDVKFIVTGSSSLELSGAMARFLVGRVFFFELFPFSFHEFWSQKIRGWQGSTKRRTRRLANFCSAAKLKSSKISSSESLTRSLIDT